MGDHAVGALNVLLEGTGQAPCCQALLEATHDGVVITAPDAVIVSVNDRYCEITGYSRAELIGQRPRLLQSGHHGGDFYDELWRSLGEGGAWQGVVWNRGPDGRVYPAHNSIAALRTLDGDLLGYVGCLRRLEVTASDTGPSEVAHTDPLTGLHNRTMFHDRLGQAMAHASEGYLRVMVINISRFRRINEGLGYAAGDTVLQTLGRRLKARIGPGETVARLGADQFGIIFYADLDRASARERATALLAAISGPVAVADQVVEVAAVGGLASFPEAGLSVTELMQAAELALQRSRRGRTGPLALASSQAARDALRMLAMESALRRAVDQGNLRVVYQPQVDLESGRVVGAEALARWTDPQLGTISPGTFIPLAEEAGLIDAVDSVVLRKAATHWRAWQVAGLDPGQLSVNVSSTRLGLGGLCDSVEAIIGESGLAPEALILEVTEGALGQPLAKIEPEVRRLRALGIQLAIDDFGVQHANLLRLAELPVQSIKVDRAFLAGTTPDMFRARLLAGIVALGRQLDLEVVVEGVEELSELALARASGATKVQGHLMGRPMGPADFESLLRRQAGQAQAG